MPPPPPPLPLARVDAPRVEVAAPLPPPSAAAAVPFGVMLLREGKVAPHRIMEGLARSAGRDVPLAEVMLAEGVLDEAEVCESLARRTGHRVLRPATEAPDPRLIGRLGAQACLREGLLPIRRVGEAVLVAAALPDAFLRCGPELEEAFGRVIPALAPRTEIEAAVAAACAAELSDAAEARVAPNESCRNWRTRRMRRVAAVLAVVVGLSLLVAPAGLFLGLTLWALTCLFLGTALRLAAAAAGLRKPLPLPDPPEIARLPMVSVIVALYGEEDIAPRLIARLSRLDYPRDRLEILLVVEACDRRTRAALDEARLPPWMRVVVSPVGSIRTKPRAMNVALDHCRGSIIGVYDAEDEPAPDQIRKVVDRFSRRGSHVACLQGVLDYYNPRTNWMSRCFTIEYAALFRLVLPGLERLGLPVPLGGTTLFVRRAALEELGAWDAHNVTEDADLGMRLARHGYRTELLDTVTGEEANCRLVPWVKQRSRWIKGFMMTWAVHMRAPRTLLRQMGAWKFLGFHVLFLGSVSQALLAPLLWSFWLVALGLPHPARAILPGGALWSLVALFLIAEATSLVIGLIGSRRTGHGLSPLWVPTMHLYNMLATFAAYKAAWELLTAPFYWDKTRHGLFDPPASAARHAPAAPGLPGRERRREVP